MESKKVEFFNKLSFVILLATIFLSLFFFIPYVPVTITAGKGFLLSIGTTLSAFFWLIARLGEGKFSLPKDRLILAAGLIPLVFLISSFFSSSLYTSLFGGGFEVGTFGSIFILYIMFFLSAIYFQTEKRLWYFVGVLFLGALIISIFQICGIFLNFDKLLPGLFQGLSSGNLIGSWNNFALFFGLIILLCLFTLEFLKTRGLFLIVQYFLLAIGLVFLMIINMPLVWILLGFFSIIIFVYSVSTQHAGIRIVHGGGEKKRFPFTALAVLLVSLSFIIGSNFFGGIISKYINISNTEIRPSIMTTSQIAWKSIKHNPFFGTGPNTFVIDWASWHQKEIAQTVFWNTDFNEGFSTFTTFVVTTGILGFIAWILFFIVLVIRGIQSLRIALKDPLSNYFIITTFVTSLYSWVVFIIYTPNIIMLMLAFVSSGMLIGVLSYRHVIEIKHFSFLNDPRNSFFSILSIMVLMIGALSITYLYIEKFTSAVYFSESLKVDSSAESLARSERMLNRAISLDKNDLYYRALSQLYLVQMNVLANDKNISQDLLKTNLQKLVNYAQNSAELAVSQNPKQYLNYLNLANVYASLAAAGVENSYENAIVSYDKASALSPYNPYIILQKAQIEVFKKNNDQARKLIDQALSLRLNYTDALFLLAQIESDEGNNSEAMKQVERAAMLNPNDANIFFRLGMLRYNNGSYSDAIGAFEQSVVLDNTALNARFFLGKSYEKVGRTDDALTQYKILNQLLPNNPDVKSAIDGISSNSNKEQSSETKTTKDQKVNKQ